MSGRTGLVVGVNVGSWGLIALAVVASRVSQRLANRRRAAVCSRLVAS